MTNENTPTGYDVTKMTLPELEAALATVIESEDLLGHPDIHTEDFLADEIARRKAPAVGGTPVFFAQGPFADDQA